MTDQDPGQQPEQARNPEPEPGQEQDRKPPAGRQPIAPGEDAVRPGNGEPAQHTRPAPSRTSAPDEDETSGHPRPVPDAAPSPTRPSLDDRASSEPTPPPTGRHPRQFPFRSPQAPPPPWHGAAPDMRGKRPMPHPHITPELGPPDPLTAFVQRHMPFAPGGAPRTAIAAAVAIALLATFTVTAGLPGIGITVTGIAVLALGLALAERREYAVRGVGALLTAGLFAVPAVIDAGPLVAASILAGLGSLAATLSPPRRFTGLLLGALSGATAWYGGFVWAKRGLSGMPGRRHTVRVVRTAVIAITALVVFGALFSSADAAFGELVNSLLPTMSPGMAVLRVILFPVLLAGVLAYAHNAVSPPRLDLVGARPAKTVGRWEWAVPLALLNGLFGAFVAVQAVAFFGGSAYVMRTTGLTYAEYARGGFWQLCWITGLTLVVIAVAVRKAPRRAAGDRVLLRVQLGLLCGLTLVIVASALHRMAAYEDAYGLTRLRVWIFAVELWLGLVFVMVLVAGVRLRASWLPRAVAASGAAVLIALAAVNPDALIAQRNVDRYLAGEHIDLNYLSGLSADAVPGLDRLSKTDRDKVLWNMDCRDWGSDGVLSWNLSRDRAADAQVTCGERWGY